MASGILEWAGISAIRSNNPDGQIQWAGVSAIRSNNPDGQIQWVGVSVIRSTGVQTSSPYKPRLNHRSFTMF